ncbi:MAG TPA: DUF4129 domain-containing protein [Candidatus Binatia bacterium]|nr:DUF4129 domain-containing protein [Candidatus Binatia bacterium]
MRIARFILLLSLLPSMALATEPPLTLAQYIQQLEQLRQTAGSARDSAATLAIAQTLPDHWLIQSDGRVFHVSTGGVAPALNDYAKQRTAANLAAVTSYIDLQLADARGMEAAKADDSAERAKLAEILARREFHDVRGETWYDRWKRAAQRWLGVLLERMLTSSAFPVVSKVIIWSLLGLAVAVAAFWVVRNYRQGNVYTTFAGAPETVSGKPWRDWQAEARIAAEEGRWRDAVHLSYWAAISFLEGQGLWRPDRARTPREYLRLLPEGDAHRDPLRQLTRNFERIWYGNEAATADSFASAAALLERLGCN